MRSMRESTAGLMGLVLIVALAVTALRTNSEAWAGSTLLATLAILGLCVTGVVCRDAEDRPRWFGAALFGWGYLAIAFWLIQDWRGLPTITLLDHVWTAFKLPVPEKANYRFGVPVASSNYEWTAHSIWALVFAVMGGSFASWLFPSRGRDPSIEPPLAFADATARISPYRPLIISFTGLGLVALIAITLVGLKPGLWAGLVFMITCGFLGIAVLGSVLYRSDHRATWLGPALFGVGYLGLAFAWRPHEARWPPLPTVFILEEVRPSIPTRLSGYPFTTDPASVANARILGTLEQSISLRFPNETSLDLVLKEMLSATKKMTGKGIPIYVDPVGLSEARRSLASTVTLDLEGVSLKSGLRACLKPLDLDYQVKDGYLMITSPTYIERPSPSQDPYMIVGQCLLAMVAAMVGAVASLIVTRREPRPASGI